MIISVHFITVWVNTYRVTKLIPLKFLMLGDCWVVWINGWWILMQFKRPAGPRNRRLPSRPQHRGGGELWSSWCDGPSEVEMLDENPSRSGFTLTAERLPASSPISVTIPPLDLSALCQHDRGVCNFSTFFSVNLIDSYFTYYTLYSRRRR